MLLSDEKRFVFIHVPKAGGSSMTAALGPWCLPRNRAPWASWARWVGLPRDYRRYRFGKHEGLAAVERRMPAELYGAYFKFAFVRNPWDRLVSDYNSVLRDPAHRRHARVRRLGSFREYVVSEAQRSLRTQLELLADSTGGIGVDFVGRFERLEADFRAVCERVGIEASLPHLNRREHEPYADYYDEETRELVRARWTDDVEAFGYEFQG